MKDIINFFLDLSVFVLIFLPLAFFIFLSLKLTDKIDWSWKQVFIPVHLLIIASVIVLLVPLFEEALSKKNKG